MDQSGSTLLAEWAGREQAAGGRDDGDRWRRRHAGPADSVRQYFATLERQGISINFGSYFSETQAREAVLGESRAQADPAELATMRAIMDTAMRGGAMGMTTALIYPPSSYASTDELIEVAKAAAAYGGAVRQSHSR